MKTQKLLEIGIVCLIGMLGNIQAAESSAEQAEAKFSAEQLVAGSLANFPSAAFESLNDYSGDPEARAILANCYIRAHTGIIKADDNNLQCFIGDANHSRLFLRDLSRVVLRTPIQLPAIDDKYRGAELYFRVLLTREGEESRVDYFANWGHDAEKYGYAYQAPQRLYSWPSRQKKFGCDRSRIVSLVTIGADSGVRDDVELAVVSGNPSAECLNAIEEYLLESQFLPGRKGEKLIEARHMELWGSWGRSKYLRSLSNSTIRGTRNTPLREWQGVPGSGGSTRRPPSNTPSRE